MPLAANPLIEVSTGLMIWTLLCFGITFFVLRKFAFGPVQNLIDERRKRIREALDRLIRARRRTVFVIAQRISTVRDADLILVLDDGGVAAQGRHADLLRDSELYNQILGSQLIDGPVSEHPLTAASSEAPA